MTIFTIVLSWSHLYTGSYADRTLAYDIMNWLSYGELQGIVGNNGSHGFQLEGLVEVEIKCNITGREAKRYSGEQRLVSTHIKVCFSI